MYFYKVLLKVLRDGDVLVATEECSKAISRWGEHWITSTVSKKFNGRNWGYNNLSSNLFAIT